MAQLTSLRINRLLPRASVHTIYMPMDQIICATAIRRKSSSENPHWCWCGSAWQNSRPLEGQLGWMEYGVLTDKGNCCNKTPVRGYWCWKHYIYYRLSSLLSARWTLRTGQSLMRLRRQRCCQLSAHSLACRLHRDPTIYMRIDPWDRDLRDISARHIPRIRQIQARRIANNPRETLHEQRKRHCSITEKPHILRFGAHTQWAGAWDCRQTERVSSSLSHPPRVKLARLLLWRSVVDGAENMVEIMTELIARETETL